MRALLLRLLLILSLVLPAPLVAQNVAAPIFSGAGAPVGSCLPAGTYYDTVTGLIWTCNNSSVWALPTKLTLLTTYTNATTTPTDVPGLTLPVAANRNYALLCYLVYQVSSTSTVPQIRFTGPVSPTSVLYSSAWQLGATTAATYASAAATAFSTGQKAAPTLAATNMVILIHAGLLNGVNAGVVQLQAAALITGTFTLQAGSWCAVQ